MYKVDGVPHPENAREKDDAKTSYFELVPADASLVGGMYCCVLLPSSCYNFRTYLYFSNFYISIIYCYFKYDCCICLKYIRLIFDTEIISNDRNANFYPLFLHMMTKNSTSALGTQESHELSCIVYQSCKKNYGKG